MKFLGIDFETNGLDTETANITEFAAVLWDAPSGRILHAVSEIVGDREGKSFPISREIEEITGLSTALITENATMSEQGGVFCLYAMIESADLVCAYNGESFDFPLFRAAYKRAVGLRETNLTPEKECDLMLSVPWPRYLGTPPLGIAAQSHGVLNPCAHAALGDVLTMKGILDRYDAFEVARIARSETITLIAEPRSQAEWDAARKAAFKWNTFVPGELAYKVKAAMLEKFSAWYGERLTFPYCCASDPRVVVSMEVPYNQRDYAKDRLYKWNPALKEPLMEDAYGQPVKAWMKKMSRAALALEQAECGFDVKKW